MISEYYLRAYFSEYLVKLRVDRFNSARSVRRLLKLGKLAASTTLCAPNIFPCEACIEKDWLMHQHLTYLYFDVNEMFLQAKFIDCL